MWLGFGFFCWVELFLSVPEGGTDEMQFKNTYLLLKSCASVSSTGVKTVAFT